MKQGYNISVLVGFGTVMKQGGAQLKQRSDSFIDLLLYAVLEIRLI